MATTRSATAAYAARPWLAAYPDGVPADYDFPRVPLTGLLSDAAASFPSNVALAFAGATITYRQLEQLTERFAAGLDRLGVRHGDRVALVLPNCPQNVIAFFAVLRLGAVVVPHNPLYTESELRHQLADSGAKVVISLDRVYPRVAAVRAETAVEHIVVTSLVDFMPLSRRAMLRLPMPSARRQRGRLVADVPSAPGVERFTSLLRGPAGPPPVHVDAEDDLALLLYTGGTTGRPRGAMLTHHNLVANAYQTRLWLPDATAGREVTLAVLPLFHAYGLTLCLTTNLLLGGKLVLLPRFEMGLLFEAIDEHQPTLFPGVPPIYRAMVDSPSVRRHDLRSIRACISGAMKLPLETQEQFERITGGRLVEGYGMTETSPATHCNPISDAQRPGTVGLPLPGTEARIVDPDDPERVVAVGQAGELAVRGSQVFRGYWGATPPGVFTKDGFLLTGDIATMDADGFFTIVDRKKELIVTGGFNVYPSEVEDVLQSIEGVAEAVVVGAPDRYRGENVKAFVVPQPGAHLTVEEIQSRCAVELTAYKVPKLIEFRDHLPRSAVGKPLRRLLVEEERQRAAEPVTPVRTSPRPVASKRSKPTTTASPTRRAPAKKTTDGPT